MLVVLLAMGQVILTASLVIKDFISNLTTCLPAQFKDSGWILREIYVLPADLSARAVHQTRIVLLVTQDTSWILPIPVKSHVQQDTTKIMALSFAIHVIPAAKHVQDQLEITVSLARMVITFYHHQQLAHQLVLK